MIVRKEKRDGIAIQFNPHELLILANALNEVCHGLPVADFSSRIGATFEEVTALLKEIHALAKSI